MVVPSLPGVSIETQRFGVLAGAGRPTLDGETARTVRMVLHRLLGRDEPIEAIVFGSRARGDHRADSDVDVAVIERAGTFLKAVDEPVR